MNSTHQHPVLDRGGSRARGGTVTFIFPSSWFRLGLAVEETSSLGAMTGNRTVGCFEDSPRLISCITRMVAVMERREIGAEDQARGILADGSRQSMRAIRRS